MNISELPDFPSIVQIKDALWKIGDVRGAAVMVGSGFSRLALLNDAMTPAPPLWSDYSQKMEKQLYPNGGAPTDPLRLAQEFKAMLGQNALDGLIHSLIQDNKWEPSALHTNLLSLPWRDVLTTNWDTLLERTQLYETEQTYDVVRTVEDIPRTSAPRIVKLHGSVPANRPFIFTEEDFRTYPNDFAPFVNLAQQVLLENELCLIGFSGDDPNFLKWAGWVRDNLGNACRQIRLVGVLNLSPSRKEMLKQNNVTIVDLSPLVEDLPKGAKHEKAIGMLLDWLLKSKPDETHVWSRPSKEILHLNSKLGSNGPPLKEITVAWKQDRLNHPGWLVSPGEIQRQLRYETNRLYPTLVDVTEEPKISRRMELLLELAYRHELAFWPLEASYAKLILDTYSSGGDKHLSQQDRTCLCAFMFTEARRHGNWKCYDFWENQLETSPDSAALVELNYGRALRAKQELDFETLDDLVSKISGDDPVWMMRQGMLYTFLYKDSQAALCFQKALTDIRSRRAKDKQSIWLLSREAWANWIFRAARSELPENNGKYPYDFDELPAHYSFKKCDPWDYLGFIDRETAEAREKLMVDNGPKMPLFNAGHSRINSGGFHFTSDAEVQGYDLCLRLQETIGVPRRIGNTTLLSTRLEGTFISTQHNKTVDYFNAATLVTSTEKGLMATVFNRLEVAKIPQSVVISLAASLQKECTFHFSNLTGNDRRPHSIGRIRNVIEIISRLCVRMPPHEARNYLHWASDLCSNDAANDWSLYEHIANVMERCVEAIPSDQKKDVSELALFLPLSEERVTNEMEKYWPELMHSFTPDDFKRPESSIRWAARIEEIIRAVASSNGIDRDRAIERLQTLNQANLLQPTEKQKLAEAIWCKTDKDSGWPSTKYLYPFIFLELPEIKRGQALELFVSQCINEASEGTVDADLANTIDGGLNTSSGVLERTKNLLPAVLTACLKWKPRLLQKEHSFNTGETEHQNERDAHAIARLLTFRILPVLNEQNITGEMKQLWHEKLSTPNNQYIIATAFEYSRIYAHQHDEMVVLIRKALHSRDTNRIIFGYTAVHRFIEEHNLAKSKIPPILISAVIAICENLRTKGLHYSLHAATALVKSGVLDGDELVRLSDTAEIVWSEFTYNSMILDQSDQTNWTLVRCECVKLAKALFQAEITTDNIIKICDESVEDPIPEVRFAE